MSWCLGTGSLVGIENAVFILRRLKLFFCSPFYNKIKYFRCLIQLMLTLHDHQIVADAFVSV